MTPLYIFDLDGTLANIEHRLPHVRLRKGSRVTDRYSGERGTALACGTDQDDQVDWVTVAWDFGRQSTHLSSELQLRKDWDAFHAECVNDEPIPEMLDLLGTLADSHPIRPPDVWVWSGRSDAVREQTAAWLQYHLHWCPDLKMRPAGDHTPDDVLKESWLHAMDPADRARLRMVFDDRSRVVDMWRRNGVRCLQVAPGNF